jgi:hypothetical protein
MSKLVNWGRWVAAVILGVGVYGGTAGILISTVLLAGVDIPLRRQWLYLIVALSLVSSLAFARGLVKLRRWAYVLAIVVGVLDLLTLRFTFKAIVPEYVGPLEFAVEAGMSFACLIWVLLPPVRAAYSRRQNFA